MQGGCQSVVFNAASPNNNVTEFSKYTALRRNFFESEIIPSEVDIDLVPLVETHGVPPKVPSHPERVPFCGKLANVSVC